MTMRSVRAELLHGDRQRNMTKLTTAFWNFANASKNCPKLRPATIMLLQFRLKFRIPICWSHLDFSAVHIISQSAVLITRI